VPRSLETGAAASISWKDADADDYSYSQEIPNQPPSRAAFSTANDDVLLAVGYRNHPVFIWNALELQLLGRCTTDGNNGIDDMAFNPNPDIVALVVSYNDGNLCVFDYRTMALTFVRPKVFAHSIACSPDGRSLVTGSSQGIIEVFEFDQDYAGNTTLTLIYCINAFDDSIRGVAFSSDGLRFVDVRSKQCRVWAPAALVRKDNELESTSDVVPLLLEAGGTPDGLEDPEITSPLVASTDGGCVVVGKGSGDVALVSTIDGKELGVLYRHARGASIVGVALGEPRNLVVSADDSGRVLAAELATPLPKVTAAAPRQKLPAAHVVLDRRFGAAVACVLVNAAADRLLVSGRDVDELWELPSGRVLNSRPPIAANTALSSLPLQAAALGSSSSDSGLAITTITTRSAFQHPANLAWFVVVVGDIARVFCWADFDELTSANGIRFGRPASPARFLESPQVASAPPPNISLASAAASYHVGPGLVVELLRPSPFAPSRLHVWPAATLDPSSESPALPATEPNLDAIGPAVLAVLGVVGASTLVFLDVNLWVCSTELRSAAAATARSGDVSRIGPSASTVVRQNQQAHARRHFFTLSEWRTAGGELRCTLAAVPAATPRSRSRDFVFASGHCVVVVKGGLEFSESVAAGAAMAMVPENGHSHAGGGGVPGGGADGQHVWKLVSGSMHRRALNR
jgi:WD40 repeat protein